MTFLQIIIQNYQTQEDENSFWGISNDGWFTGLVPVLIFILGYLINKLIENQKEKKRLNELEEYFKSSIELLKKPLNRQVNEFQKISHLLKERKEQHLVFIDVTNFHVDQIKEISNKDLYSIFIKNKKASILEKTELYGKLKGGIDYIDNIKKTIRNKFPMFWESYKKNENDFKSNIEIIDQLFNNMISESNSSTIKEDWLVYGIDQIRMNWISSAKEKQLNYMDMYVSKELYLEPVRKLCKQNVRDPRAAELIKYLMHAIYAFNNIDETKRFFRKQFLIEARGLQKNWIEINEVIKRFDSM